MKKLNNRNNYQAGISIIEVAVVGFIIMTAMTALVSVTVAGLTRNRIAKERAVATRLAQEAAEWLRFERDRLTFGKLYEKCVSGTCYTCLSTLRNPNIDPIQDGLRGQTFDVSKPATCPGVASNTLFSRLLKLDQKSTNEMNYEVTVFWNSTASQQNEVTVKGVLSEWQK